MKNTVTFETAKRLKEAGFPQPEPEQYQFWYSNNGEKAVLSAEVESPRAFSDYMKRHEWSFAPTATDILFFVDAVFWFNTFEKKWTVTTTDYGEMFEKIGQHENPLSLAWDEWAESPEGKAALDGRTIYLSESQERFLKNRLERAFIAGSVAQKKLFADLTSEWHRMLYAAYVGAKDLKEETFAVLHEP